MANIFTSQSGLSHAAKAYVMAGRGFVVDVAGRGDFTSIQTACNALYARGGGGRVWIRNGTYYETIATNASHDNLVIEGESWDTVIDGGTTNAHTCHVLGDYCTIQNIQVKNTQGAGNTAMAVFLKGDHGRARMVYVSSSDKEGIYGEGSDWRVLDCLATNCDSRGIYFEAQWGNVLAIPLRVAVMTVSGWVVQTILFISGTKSPIVALGDNYLFILGQYHLHWQSCER